MKEINYKKLNIFSLKTLKNQKSPLYNQTMDWIKSMKEKKDGENGNEFSKWIKTNLNNNPPFDTYILVQNNNLVLGTASIISTNQCVGKQINIEGIWLGGVNIHRDYRNQGLGNILIDFIDNSINLLAKKNKKIYTLNLFSKNPIAISMYEKRKFTKLKNLFINHKNHKNEVYSKKYKN